MNTNTLCQTLHSLLPPCDLSCPPQWKGGSRIGAVLHTLVAERNIALGSDIPTSFLSPPVAAEGVSVKGAAHAVFEWGLVKGPGRQSPPKVRAKYPKCGVALAANNHITSQGFR